MSNLTKRIKGSFKGWKHGRVFELQYGEFWKQTQMTYSYRYAYNPRADVVQRGGRDVLVVESMPDGVEVRRCSRPDDDDD